MAIVPDKSGVRPGRPGNTPLKDPRNRSTKSRMLYDDNYSTDASVVLIDGNQQVVTANQTRNMLAFFNAEGNDAVYISMEPLTSANGIPIYAGNGFELRGKAAEQAYYCYGVDAQVLTILEG